MQLIHPQCQVLLANSNASLLRKIRSLVGTFSSNFLRTRIRRILNDHVPGFFSSKTGHLIRFFTRPSGPLIKVYLQPSRFKSSIVRFQREIANDGIRNQPFWNSY